VIQDEPEPRPGDAPKPLGSSVLLGSESPATPPLTALAAVSGDADASCSEPAEAGSPSPLQCSPTVAIIAQIKPFRAQAVLAALQAIETRGVTVREVMGFGRQKNRLRHYLGSEYDTSFLPKVELTVFVAEKSAEEAIRAIVSQARTGRIGDGKILVLRCLEEYLSW
jgi:nitrogen regulatory protein PII